jgi:hypothetical protein
MGLLRAVCREEVDSLNCAFSSAVSAMPRVDCIVEDVGLGVR